MKRAFIVAGIALGSAFGLYRLTSNPSQRESLLAQNALQITTQTLPPATSGAPYAATIQASAPVALWFLWQYAPLPDGLGLNAGSGALTGTPTTPGTYNVTVFAQDANGAQSAPQRLALVVN